VLRRRRERGLTDTGYGGFPCWGAGVRLPRRGGDNREESEDGEIDIFTKEDLASLSVEQSHEIEVTGFVPADQVDPVAFDSAYFLEPASRSNRAYVLKREAL
jgi:hypothetical protein